MIVLSLGGSLIAPAGIDIAFLARLRTLLLAQVRQGKRFLVVCGGGATARSYQQAAHRLADVPAEELDLIGIQATRLNAHLLRAGLGSLAHPAILASSQRVKTDKPVVVAAGWKPGNSTDYVAVALAKAYKCKSLLNLTNVDYVCTRDPNRYPDAAPLKDLTWKGYHDLFGLAWKPGMHAPFDPAAAALARSARLPVIILNGTNIPNLEKCLDGKPFEGTTIR
ncbi:MAG: UMP kinase [Candidatus Aenigmarchaeota archaeon]|nr:UMP kinase [Candidatus Aenigmarchaeota archaeon]